MNNEGQNQKQAPGREASAMSDLLSGRDIAAIKDARDFLDVVADDRDNAYIGWERQEEVVRILDELLAKLKAA